MIHLDLAEVERRIFAVDRLLFYSWAYGGTKLVRERIDEEGSGAVFAAAVFGG